VDPNHRITYRCERNAAGAMVTTHLVPDDIKAAYEVHEWRNATGVLQTAHNEAWQDVLGALRAFEFRRSEVLKGGGRKSVIANRIDSYLTDRGWAERKFQTKIKVDADERDSPTHKVDCFKGRVGLEIEWNNKDPFFDRDLNNFRLLFDLRVIEVGIIVTRSSRLQATFAKLGSKVANKYGSSTTHMDKLLFRIEGGSGGGCPILAFGITDAKYIEDEPAIAGGSDDDQESVSE
jgi:hypothetical protein